MTDASVNGEYITAEALTPLLDKMKNEIKDEIVQVTARLSTEITSHLIHILDQKIETAVDPLRHDVEQIEERLGRHSNALTEHEQSIVNQVSHDKRINDLFEKTDKRFGDMVKQMDSVASIQNNLQSMVDFYSRETGEARSIAERVNERVERHLIDSLELRERTNKAIAELTASVQANQRADEAISKRLSGLEQQVAVQGEVIASVGKVFKFLRPMAGKVLTVAGLLLGANAVPVLNFIGQILGVSG